MKFNFRLGKLACNELDNNTPITLHIDNCVFKENGNM